MKRTKIMLFYLVALAIGSVFAINSTLEAGKNTTIELFFTGDVNSYLKPCG